MKKSLLYALGAVLYIVSIATIMYNITSSISEQTVLLPIVILSLFVLSVTVMIFMFFYEPIMLFLDGKKKEAVIFFAHTTTIFAIFVAILLVILFVV